MRTQDPTGKDYKGLSPNFGGGLVKDGDGIGSTLKAMRKLTHVLSKNQKLYSMNQPSPREFTKKVNLNQEVNKQKRNERLGQELKFVEENLPVLEAIKEAKEVRAYLLTEESANKFV